jgi:glutamate-1-semialdehyde aminotransferase
MFKRTDTRLSADDVGTMLTYAGSSFAKLAALTAAISELTSRPDLAKKLAHTAQELADELADQVSDFKREYDAALATLAGSEHEAGNA